jgi:hypothetical protein
MGVLDPLDPTSSASAQGFTLKKGVRPLSILTLDSYKTAIEDEEEDIVV